MANLNFNRCKGLLLQKYRRVNRVVILYNFYNVKVYNVKVYNAKVL